MEITIEVRPAKELGISEWNLSTASKILIGLFDAVNHGLYVEGYRNNIAVDLSIASSVLGLDLIEVADNLPLDANKKADLEDRLEVIENYIDRWMSINPWNFMLMRDDWLLWYEKTEHHYLDLIES